MNRIRPDKEAQILKWLRAGGSVRAIARHVGVNKDTVCAVAARHGLGKATSAWQRTRHRREVERTSASGRVVDDLADVVSSLILALERIGGQHDAECQANKGGKCGSHDLDDICWMSHWHEIVKHLNQKYELGLL